MVEGFMAAIFQYETDHLIGILFTGRLGQQLVKTILNYKWRGKSLSRKTEKAIVVGYTFIIG
jgi:peptide deformylase